MKSMSARQLRRQRHNPNVAACGCLQRRELIPVRCPHKFWIMGPVRRPRREVWSFEVITGNRAGESYVQLPRLLKDSKVGEQLLMRVSD